MVMGLSSPQCAILSSIWGPLYALDWPNSSRCQQRPSQVVRNALQNMAWAVPTGQSEQKGENKEDAP